MTQRKMSLDELLKGLALIEQQFKLASPSGDDEKVALNFGVNVIQEAQIALMEYSGEDFTKNLLS